jgi:hypothetical protein
VNVNVHLITRSDPDAIVCVDPKEKRSYTRLEDLRENPGIMFRRDIALVNVEREGIDHRQYAVYPSRSGNPTGDGWEWLNKAEREFVRDENKRLIEIAKVHPEFDYYLGR